MKWTDIAEQIARPSKRWDLVLVAVALLSVSLEIFFQANGAKTLDWNDWLFWAKQNYEQMIGTRNPFSLVISPVQGLFGLSYPLNPFFNPLWLLAALISDSIQAHRATTLIVFVLFAAAMYLLFDRWVKNPWFRLLTFFFTLNVFFFGLLPLSDWIAYPKTSFAYFRLMPPQNMLLVEALIVFFFATRQPSTKLNTLIVVGISVIAILSDPFYFFIYFTPIILVLAIYFLLNITTRWKDCLIYCLAGVLLFFIGIFEFPFLLQDSIARTVFNDSLFHSIKVTRWSSLVFQYPQNIFYSLLLSIGLVYLSFKKKDRLALSILSIKVLFVFAGASYLSGVSNFNFMPPLPAFEISMIALYFIFGARGLEVFLNESNLVRPFKSFSGPLLLLVCIGFVALKATSSFDAAAREREITEHYTNAPLVLTEEQINKVQNGSISFALGTEHSEFNKNNSLPERFGIENRSFVQNNEGEVFYDKYGQSISFLSYWLSGQPTLEENNHMTDAFYLYFFRRLFMQPDDYYGTNSNNFTRPRMHLYPMLGVEHLFTDDRTQSKQSTSLLLNDERFFLHTFYNFNLGQYSPAEIRYIRNADQAIQILNNDSFDSHRTALIHKKEESKLSEYYLIPATYGQVEYEKNRLVFEGRSQGTSLSIIPVLFSNCLISKEGYRLIRVNLVLTGILYEGTINTKIGFIGPPFDNSCLAKDINDIETFKLRDQPFPYPDHYDRGEVNLLREYVIGVIYFAGLYDTLVSFGLDLDSWEYHKN